MELFEGYVLRSKLHLQVFRPLNLRVVVQYDDFESRWDIDPLFTYRINSFSVFYAGTSYTYLDLPGEDNPEDISARLTSRQFFVKLQYLFQM